MKVRELTLVNYRAFSQPDTFHFSEQFTAVAGINGRGKTALLESLALLFSRFLPFISPSRSRYRTIDPSDLHMDAPFTEMAVKLNCAGIPINYSLKYEKEKRNITTTKLSSFVQISLRNAYGDSNRQGDVAPLAVYYTTERSVYRQPKTLPDPPRGQDAAYIGALFNKTINFRDFVMRYRNAIILGSEEYCENPYFFGYRVVEAISRAITTFLDNFDNLRVQEKPLSLLVDKAGVPLDLSQLSDGERSFLALICDLGRRMALANPTLENPLDGPGVVLIDELELHLHPTWQREVVDKLRLTFPNIQFIVTTHSPFVIQSLRPGELINLDPEEFPEECMEYSDKSIEDIAENVMGIELPQKSERYMKMMRAAEDYFRLLREPNSQMEIIKVAEQHLNELAAPFSDDPAFQALLKLEREIQKGESNNATD